MPHSTNVAYVYHILASGNIRNNYRAYNPYRPRPVVYLKPNVKIFGDGTSSNPYQLSL